MKRLLRLAAFCAGVFPWTASAQQPQPVLPDCIINFNFIGAGSTPVTANGNCAAGDNRFTGADTWTLQYTATGFTGLTLTFQSAPTGPVAPGTFVTYSGTVVQGTNAMTSTTEGAATFSNLLGATPVATPWVRVTLSGLTGSGQVTGSLQGWRTGYSAGGGGGTPPCPGTVALPCVVHDYLFNGSMWNPSLGGCLPAIISTSSSGNTPIVLAVGIASIRVCKLSLTAASTVSVQLFQATGPGCTGPTAITGLYQNITALAEDYLADQSLVVLVGGDNLCLNLSSAVLTTGTVWFVND